MPSQTDYITDAEVVRRADAAVRLALEKLKALDIPAVIYDSETQHIYHVHSDGTRTEAAKRLYSGRYSERILPDT